MIGSLRFRLLFGMLFWIAASILVAGPAFGVGHPGDDRMDEWLTSRPGLSRAGRDRDGDGPRGLGTRTQVLAPASWKDQSHQSPEPEPKRPEPA